MRISNNTKDFLIGFPVVLLIAVVVVWLCVKLGPPAIILIGGLVMLGFIGTGVGKYLRDNFRIWK